MAKAPIVSLIEGLEQIAGRYHNLTALGGDGGKGCFSIVFSGLDQTTGKPVILKCYDPLKYSDTERVKRFEREAEVLKMLRGVRGIVQYIDGICEHTFILTHEKGQIPYPVRFIVLEKADSNVESTIYASNQHPMLRLLRFKQMINAVMRLHARNLCHRDLKPSNFLIKGRSIRLSDFGTAKKIYDGPEISTDNYFTPVGDRRYIPPEAFMGIGNDGVLAAKADIFALGAILFEMFTELVFTTEAFNLNTMGLLTKAHINTSRMKQDERMDAHKHYIRAIESQMSYPDIYAYNDSVPKCIKVQLNTLYKALCSADYMSRPHTPAEIHRKIDICLITLRNNIRQRRRN